MPARVEGQPHRRDEPAAYSRLWREKNREHVNAYYRKRHAEKKVDPEYRAAKNGSSIWTRRKAKYGVTRDQYEAMLAKQAGKCAICGEEFGYGLRVDHDHQTGEVRDLLCSGCNAGLGMFRENPTSLSNAMKYLDKHRRENREAPACGFGIECSPLEP